MTAAGGGRALAVEGLTIARTSDRARPIVSGVDLRVEPGECLGIVGESGSGKSLTLRAIAGILPDTLAVTAGTVAIDGVPAGSRARRRPRVGVVFQDPAAALDPLRRVGAQVAAVRRRVRGRTAAEARDDAVRLLARARLPEPEALARRYPHELSGGQRQRVMIAFALANDPAYLLCDEPTTALDVTVQAEILALLDEIRAAESLGVLFVSHDLPVIARVSGRIAVMRAGGIVETGATDAVLRHPRHAYTRELIGAARAVAAAGRGSA